MEITAYFETSEQVGPDDWFKKGHTMTLNENSNISDIIKWRDSILKNANLRLRDSSEIRLITNK